jgi:hypothetical protein
VAKRRREAAVVRIPPSKRLATMTGARVLAGASLRHRAPARPSVVLRRRVGAASHRHSVITGKQRRRKKPSAAPSLHSVSAVKPSAR